MKHYNIFKNSDEPAEVLTALGNSKRLAIVTLLLDQELSVGALATQVRLSQSALSQHLARLRNLGLVETRRDRQMIYYSCRSTRVRQLVEAIDRIFEAA
ncbi:MAG: winged helix-turn-helix transcriptional regulator [Rhizobiaceae bacterium]|nr:winged helix-turn-helix transcriptional regulator [Rhizobiaceae bacterium]